MEIITKLGLRKEKGYWYYLNRKGEIWRIIPGKNVKDRKKAKIISTGLEIDKRYIYCINKEGDIIRNKKKILPPLIQERILCVCGCGQNLNKYDIKKRVIRRFLCGHNRRKIKNET